jgi:hypothetical protein
MHPKSRAVTHDDILITPQPSWCLPRRSDSAPEILALFALVCEMAVDPCHALQTLVSIAVDWRRASPSGISLLRADTDGTYPTREALSDIFDPYLRWRAAQRSSSRNASPGLNVLQLLSNPGRYFAPYTQSDVPITEHFVIPLCTDGWPHSAVWMMARGR